MKKFILLLCVVLLLSGCAGGAPETVPTTEAPTEITTVPTTEATEPTKQSRADTKLFILLPDESTLAWQSAGQDLQMLLENLFYQVELLYARSDAREQADQLAYAIEQGADGVILAPVESAALTDVCRLAQEQKIPIFSYDRMLMDTEAVSYYVSFDYQAMGAALGQHIIAQKALDDPEQPVTIEFFMGSPEDNNALLLYKGVMSQLQPYLDSGALVCKSGRVAFEDTCVVDWNPLTVSESLESYIKEYYKKSAPDVICTVSDSFASACIGVLDQKKIKAEPLITGVGGTDSGKQNIAEGRQSITLSTDLLQLNEQLAQTVDAVMTGKEPELNDTESCHNNAKTVPAYLCQFATYPQQPAETEPTTPTGTEPTTPTVIANR